MPPTVFRMLVLCLSMVTAVPSATAQSWETQRQVNPMTDAVTMVAAVADPETRFRPAIFSYLCSDTGVEGLTFHRNRPLPDGIRTFSIRVDQNEPFTLMVRQSDFPGEMLTVSTREMPPSQFNIAVDRLLAAEARIVVGVVTGVNRQETFVFPAEGITVAIDEARSGCGLSISETH